VVGYHIYRGLAPLRTVRKGEPGAWKDNHPEYAEPAVVKMTDITQIAKLTNKRAGFPSAFLETFSVLSCLTLNS